MNSAAANSPYSSHALVIGGSIAGLLAARVLSNHFERVTVVEKDPLDARSPLHTPVFRPGVPQATQVHVLLARGQHLLEQFFPGFTEELKTKGAVTLDWTADGLLLFRDHWSPRFASNLVTQTCTRQLLETTIRERLHAIPKIHWQDGCKVTGLLSNEDQRVIQGVQVSQANGEETSWLADLVVDASGRDSRVPQWLERLGYSPPPETVVNAFLGYGSRWYQQPLHFQADWKALYLAPRPQNDRRGGVLYPVEGNRWILTVVGVGRDYPPTDEVEFQGFVKSLRSSIFAEAIRAATPLSPIYAYHRTENRLRHYEQLAKLPEKLVVLGDAVCSFNPIYGQGMTVAALGALTLDQCLSNQPGQGSHRFLGLPQTFQKSLAKVVQLPWLLATGEDFRWTTTVGGEPSFLTRLMQSYVDRVMFLAGDSAQIHQTLLNVMHLLEPPNAFFSPHVIFPVLKSYFKKI